MLKNKRKLTLLILLFVFVVGVSVSCVSAADSSGVSSVKAKEVSQNDILGASKSVKSYTEKNKKLPGYVTIKNQKYSMEEYMYLSSVTLNYRYLNKKNNVVVKYDIKSPTSPAGSRVYGILTKKQFAVYGTNVCKYINKYGVAPNYVSTKIGKMQFQTFVYANSKILAWSANNKAKLPNSLSMSVSAGHSINKNMPKYSGSSGSSGSSNETKPPVVNPGKSVSMNSIFEASNRVKNYIEKNNAIPKTVGIGSDDYSINDFLYLLSKAIVNRNNGVTTSIFVLSTSAPSGPSGNNKLGKLYKAEFVSIAKNLANYYTTNKKAPNYLDSSLGKLQYQSTIYVFSRIGAYIYNNKNSIPSYVEVTVNSKSKINAGNVDSNSSIPGPTITLLGSDSRGTVQLIGAYGNTSSNRKIAYVIGLHPLEGLVHAALLESIIKKNSSLKYCYYIYFVSVTKDFDDYSKGRMNGQTLARDFVLPHIKTKNYDLVVDIHSNQGTIGGNYEETNFIFAPRDKGVSKKIAEDLISQIPGLCYYYPNSQTSPPYLTEPLVDAGINTIIYETYMYESESITYNLVEKLINAVDKYNFNSLNGSQSNSTGTSVSLSNIKDAAKRVEAYVIANGVLPNTVNINGKIYKMEEFLYLLSAAIVNINKGSSADVKLISVNAASSPIGDSVYGDLTKTQFVTLATNVYNYILNNGQAPNYASSDLGRIQFQSLVYQFSRILEFAYSEGRLPNFVTISVDTSAKLNGGSGNNGGNSSSGNISEYLKATKNCQVNDSKIQSLAKQLTSGLTSELAKATAIFNYVRDDIAYSFYYNTMKGAVGTLNAKSGNCVDKTHLLIALLRASGIGARYVNGKATFSSSGHIGHTWAEIYIDGKWFIADITSSRNTIGNVNNCWNHEIWSRTAQIDF